MMVGTDKSGSVKPLKPAITKLIPETFNIIGIKIFNYNTYNYTGCTQNNQLFDGIDLEILSGFSGLPG